MKDEIHTKEDISSLALTLRDEKTSCPGGEWCPRCRIADAVTEMTYEHELPLGWGDDMIVSMTRGMPDHRPWSKAEADEAILAAGKSPVV